MCYLIKEACTVAYVLSYMQGDAVRHLWAKGVATLTIHSSCVSCIGSSGHRGRLADLCLISSNANMKRGNILVCSLHRKEEVG